MFILERLSLCKPIFLFWEGLYNAYEEVGSEIIAKQVILFSCMIFSLDPRADIRCFEEGVTNTLSLAF